MQLDHQIYDSASVRHIALNIKESEYSLMRLILPVNVNVVRVFQMWMYLNVKGPNIQQKMQIAI